MKTKLELIMEERFDVVKDGKDTYLVSKDTFIKSKSDRIVLVIEDRDDGSILISLDNVDSLANQDEEIINFMLGYYDNASIDEVLSSPSKFEEPIFYVDLLKQGYYRNINFKHIEHQKQLREVRKGSSILNSKILIKNILELLKDVRGFSEFLEEANRMLGNKKETLAVNLIAPPGSGKSTMAASIFAKLKWLGVDSELVSEFAKELVWEERNKTFKDEIYIFAKQFHRMFRLKEKVDVVVTDRPLILSAYYNNKYGNGQFEKLNDLVIEQHYSFRNLNIYLNRTKEYNPNGRNQTEKESDLMGDEILHMLDESNIEYIVMDAKEKSVDRIVDMIKQLLD